jgi:hypothetical protein
MRCWIISILLVLMGSSYIHSQQASDKVSYEGQTVTVVDLVANPKISVDFLRPVIEQRTGEAYSGSKVESTIAALRATGRFTAVKVDVKPDKFRTTLPTVSATETWLSNAGGELALDRFLSVVRLTSRNSAIRLSIAFRSRTESTSPAPSACTPRTADHGAGSLLRPGSLSE